MELCCFVETLLIIRVRRWLSQLFKLVELSVDQMCVSLNGYYRTFVCYFPIIPAQIDLSVITRLLWKIYLHSE